MFLLIVWGRPCLVSWARLECPFTLLPYRIMRRIRHVFGTLSKEVESTLTVHFAHERG
jgi:hypothetical protein